MSLHLRMAADQRCGRMRASDRPSRRRCGADGQAQPRAHTKAHVELREAGTSGSLQFHGIASRTDTPYEMWDMFGPYTEVVVGGAFANTLTTPDLDVPLVLAHDRMQVLARTTSTSSPLHLNESADGLEADAPNLDPTMPYVADTARLIDAGLVDEMSFKFTIVRGQWSPDWMEYHIEEVDIHRGDVAIVGYGANPYTTAELRTERAAAVDLSQRTDRYVLEQFRTLRAELRSRGLQPPMSLEDIAG